MTERYAITGHWRGMDLDSTSARVQQTQSSQPVRLAWHRRSPSLPTQAEQSCTPALGTASGPPRSNAVGATEHPQASCG
jgi:hypothetical protein